VKNEGLPALSPRLLAQVIDLAEDAIISVDAGQRIVLFNQGAERIFGYKSQDMIGKHLDALIPERMAKHHRRQVTDFIASGAATRQKSERTPIVGLRSDGTEFPAEASISRVDSGGGILLTVILRDISQRVAAAEKIQQSIREKEALLREIHHRVKNNLQVMSSLLGLQARSVQRPDARPALEDSQDRIHSMALIHDLLCRSPDFSGVNAADYTVQLCDYRLRACGPDANRIRLVTDLAPISLDLDSAVPYGLILNELLANSLRHAFPNGRAGEIRITLRSLPSKKIQLALQDDGVGFPDGFNWQSAPSLGFRLVRMLAEELKGRLELSHRNPTAVRLTFASR